LESIPEQRAHKSKRSDFIQYSKLFWISKTLLLNPYFLAMYVKCSQTVFWSGQRRTDFVPWPKYHKKRNHLKWSLWFFPFQKMKIPSSPLFDGCFDWWTCFAKVFECHYGNEINFCI
jgi:hypothetical protein